MIRPYKNKPGYFEVDFYHSGRRYRKRIKGRTAAIDFENRIVGQNAANGNAGSSFGSALAGYISYCRLNKSDTTVRSDIARLSIFFNWAKKENIEYLSEITPPFIEKFKIYYLANGPLDSKKAKRGRNPKSTFNKYLEIIKSFLNWSVNNDLLTQNPLKRMPGFKDIQRRFPRFFSKEELAIIFKSAPPAYADYFRMLAYTGLRAGELDHLDWQDIDQDRGIIKIQSKPGFHTKTYHIRSIPIHSEIKHFLSVRVPGHRYIFDDGHGNHAFRQNAAYCHLKNILRLNNLPDGNLYSFRHTFASHLVMVGIDLATIKELMGHASITTTEQYLHVAPERKKFAVESLQF